MTIEPPLPGGGKQASGRMGFRLFGLSVLALNLLVILWGAYVRATGSGAGCGRHWPLCDGQVIPRDPAAATLVEFTHRLSSGLAFAAVLALWLFARARFKPRHPARRASRYAFVFILIEALIGAGLVLFGLVSQNDSLARGWAAMLHLVNTFLLIGCLALAVHWSGEAEWAVREIERRSLFLLSLGLVGVMLIGASGAIAALGDTLFPASDLMQGLRADVQASAHWLVRLRALHPLIAAAVGTYLLALTWLGPHSRETQPWRMLLRAAVLVQWAAGLVNLLLLAPLGLQILHLALADATWLILVLFADGWLRAGPPMRTEG